MNPVNSNVSNAVAASHSSEKRVNDDGGNKGRSPTVRESEVKAKSHEATRAEVTTKPRRSQETKRHERSENSSRADERSNQRRSEVRGQKVDIHA